MPSAFFTVRAQDEEAFNRLIWDGTLRGKAAAFWSVRRVETEALTTSVGVSSITVLSTTSIRVNFTSSLPLNDALLSTDIYKATPSLDIVSVEPQPGGTPSYVILTTSEHLDGQVYALNVLNFDGSSVSGQFIGQGSQPSVLSASGLGDRKARVVFDEPMLKNAALLDPLSYSITPGGGSVPLVVVAVNAGPGENPTYVEISFDKDMTIGVGNYIVEVGPLVADAGGNLIDPLADTATFGGIGDRLRITLVSSSVDQIGVVQVQFSKPVKQVSAGNADDASNPANYVIAGQTTVSVLGVTSLSSSTVLLAVTGQVPGNDYLLTVSNVEDLSNNVIEG